MSTWGAGKLLPRNPLTGTTQVEQWSASFFTGIYHGRVYGTAFGWPVTVPGGQAIVAPETTGQPGLPKARVVEGWKWLATCNRAESEYTDSPTPATEAAVVTVASVLSGL